MATLVLSTVGGLVGGPIGRAIGAQLGLAVDRRLFGTRRQGPRLTDLSVQSSAYGEPLSRVYGSLRVAGAVIWSTGLKETARTSGGGKRSGGRTTTYSYSASFAVAISARPIRRVKRIWADGKLLRRASGEWLMPATMRLHPGGENQAPDPLVASAEGASGTPAYRGLAYAVFEDLPLADFANRVPNLSFEVEADDGAVPIATIIEDACAVAGVRADASGVGERVAGFGIGRAASLRAILETLEGLAPLSLAGARTGLFLSSRPDAALPLPEADLGGEGVAVRAERRGGVDGLPGEVALGFLDIGRDYQAGLQRARRRGASVRGESLDLPAAMSAPAAKLAAERLLAERWARRTTAELRLPWRYLALAPGDAVATPDGAAWRVTRQSVAGMAITLELERLTGPARIELPPSDGGRAITDIDAPHGDSELAVLDLPPLSSEVAVTPRLWLAAAGAETGWRRAELLASLDGGAIYATIGVAGAGAVMGRTLAPLPPGPCDRWDRRSAVEVELLSGEMWLESRGEASVLAGANLAAIGTELVQFTTATALGERRFRLSGFLRGRRGSEAAAGGHAAGERFVLIDPAALVPFDAPLGTIGGAIRVKALSPGQALGQVAPVVVGVVGRALRPLSPVHLRTERLADGAIRFSWVRRSRQGFDWLDGADAPLAEERERYAVTIAASAGSRHVERRAEVAGTGLLYPAAEQLADLGSIADRVSWEVAQIGALTGSGDAAVQQWGMGVP